MVEASGVELIEFQVRDPAAGSPGHRNSVATGTVRVARVQVNLGCTAGSQDRKARDVSVDFAAAAVQDVGAQAALAFKSEAGFGDEVDGCALVQQMNVRAQLGLVEQGSEDRRAGGVGRVDDTSMAVAALACQVKFETAFVGFALFPARKRYALVDEPLNRFAAVLHGEADCFFIAQSTARVERVFDMRLHRVGVVKDRGNSTLSPKRRAVGQVALAQDRDLQMRREVERQAQPCRAAADYQNIMLKLLAHE